ncbi:hypothetical protein PR048_032367 [Dryococelus australis]|uniref:Uncharacterized protein n=1 Tax=Dryococelus australis TaxID=614101 RepID=A0ABQ9G222_9NEOP|nr:hypothetical protein PR048_032367 [Dryococelus australis]
MVLSQKFRRFRRGSKLVCQGRRQVIYCTTAAQTECVIRYHIMLCFLKSEVKQLPIEHCTRLYNVKNSNIPHELVRNLMQRTEHRQILRRGQTEGVHFVSGGGGGGEDGAVAERSARSPPTRANRAETPAVSPDFRKWELCRTIPLVGWRGFVEDLHSSAAPYSLHSPSSALLRAAEISQGESGALRENPLTSDIVRHNSHVRKKNGCRGGGAPGIKRGSSRLEAKDVKLLENTSDATRTAVELAEISRPRAAIMRINAARQRNKALGDIHCRLPLSSSCSAELAAAAKSMPASLIPHRSGNAASAFQPAVKPRENHARSGSASLLFPVHLGVQGEEGRINKLRVAGKGAGGAVAAESRMGASQGSARTFNSPRLSRGNRGGWRGVGGGGVNS